MIPAASGAFEFFFIVHALVSSGPDVKNVNKFKISYPAFIKLFKPISPIPESLIKTFFSKKPNSAICCSISADIKIIFS